MLPWDGTVSLRWYRELAYPAWQWMKNILYRCIHYLAFCLSLLLFSPPGGISGILFVKLLNSYATSLSSISLPSLSPVGILYSTFICCIEESALIIKHRNRAMCSASQIFIVPLWFWQCQERKTIHHLCKTSPLWVSDQTTHRISG